MNFTIYFQATDSGYAAYTFNFVDGKMNWAAYADGKKESDVDVMAELLREARDTMMPCYLTIAD